MVLSLILFHVNITSEAFKKTINKFGDLDIVVNNAGIYNEKKWKYELSVNLVSSTKKLNKLEAKNYMPYYVLFLQTIV
jgi:NAD(P)-dependent dehydrogenase (short-subunit alcohol dehydrogenase family)